VGPKSVLHALEKRKILPLPGIEPRPSNSYPVATPTELSRIYLRYIGKEVKCVFIRPYAVNHE
jgi:hypothetical protein